MTLRSRIATSVAVAATLAFGAATAQAAPTETVTNLNDSGAGSLRQALADVDAGGTVSFDSSVSGTIELQTALVVDKSFTLTGPGARQVTIDAGNRDNILVIGSVTPGNYEVVVEGLTFFRGAAREAVATLPTTAEAGGGIAFEDGNALTVRDSVFRQNLASASNTSANGGGGIYVAGCSGSNDGAALTIETSTFVRNVAFEEAGAVAMRSKGALTISDSEFRNNAGEGGSGGGALLVEPGFTDSTPECVFYGSDDRPSTAPVAITDSLFATNGGHADDEGPAISFAFGVGPKTIDSTEITGNGGDGDSGALWDNSASPLVITDSLFQSNAVESRGGAIYQDADYGGPAFTDAFLLEVRDSAFLGNSAEGDGGAIYYDPSWTNPGAAAELELRVIDSEFIGNSSHDAGGAIESEASGGVAGTPVLSIRGSRFERNFGYGSSAGGVIEWDASVSSPNVGEIEIRDTTIDSNAGGEGGTPVNLDGGTADTVMENVSVTRNVVGDSEEAAILLRNSNYTPTDCSDPALVRSTYELTNVTVAGNVSSQSDDGTVALTECGDLELESSTIALNVVVGSSGAADGNAGLRVIGESVATVQNSVIAVNSFGSTGAPSVDQGDCFVEQSSQLVFAEANLVGSLTGCETATGTNPITGDPGFAELDPVEVQRLGTDDGTFIVPLAADSPARGEALGSYTEGDQRGADRPLNGADLGAVQYYETHALTVAKAGSGEGRVSSNWGMIECGEACEDSYPDEQVVTLTASPDAGSAFTGWSGGCTGTAYTCEVTVDQAKTATATFGTGASGGNANIRVRPAARNVIRVNRKRTFAVARVTCLVGECRVRKVSGLGLSVRSKRFTARAILPKGSFAAGETRAIRVRIPKRAYNRLLRTRRSGTLRLASFSVANDSAGKVRMKVYRNFQFKLRRQ